MSEYDDTRKEVALSLKGLGIWVGFSENHRPYPDWPDAHHYDVTFSKNVGTLDERSFEFEFHAGRAVRFENEFEFAADVLHCLFSDAESVVDYDFAEWCEEFGYADEPLRDYQQFRDMYDACRETHDKLCELFGEAYGTVNELVSEL